MTELRMRIDAFEVELKNYMGKPVGKERWLEAKPDANLSWGLFLTGESFIHRVMAWEGFGVNKSILEVAPGYGRLLRSILSLALPFKEHLGIDISKPNVDYLKTRFSKPGISFLPGDIESITLNCKYDTIISSLTFKHLFPTFERSLANLSMYAKPMALFFFDLLEYEGGGPKGHFEEDRVIISENTLSMK